MRQLLSVFLTHLDILKPLLLNTHLVPPHGLVDDSLSIRVVDVVSEPRFVRFEEDGVFAIGTAYTVSAVRHCFHFFFEISLKLLLHMVIHDLALLLNQISMDVGEVFFMFNLTYLFF